MGPKASEAVTQVNENVQVAEDQADLKKVCERYTNSFVYEAKDKGLNLQEWTNKIPITATASKNHEIIFSMENRGGEKFYAGHVLLKAEGLPNIFYLDLIIEEGQEVRVELSELVPIKEALAWNYCGTAPISILLIDEKSWKEGMG